MWEWLMFGDSPDWVKFIVIAGIFVGILAVQCVLALCIA